MRKKEIPNAGSLQARLGSRYRRIGSARCVKLGNQNLKRYDKTLWPATPRNDFMTFFCILNELFVNISTLALTVLILCATVYSYQEGGPFRVLPAGIKFSSTNGGMTYVA